MKPRVPLKFQEIADPQSFKWYQAIVNALGNLTTTVKSLRVDFPRIYTVSGSVHIDSIPPVEVKNFPDLNNAFKSVALGINSMQEAIIKAISSQKLEVPKSTSINNEVSMKGMSDLLDGVEELKKGFNILIKATQESKGMDSGKPLAVEIVADLPRPMATPVTNISLNGLGGFAKATAVTVTSGLTVLPGTALTDRRSLIIYNNSNQTLEIGGSTFTFGNGLPIPTLSYSPVIDASAKLVIYGRVTSGSADVRIFEMSDINTGR